MKYYSFRSIFFLWTALGLMACGGGKADTDSVSALRAAIEKVKKKKKFHSMLRYAILKPV